MDPVAQNDRPVGVGLAADAAASAVALVDRAPASRGDSDGLREGAATPLRERILAATLRCVARWGVAKTTLDDVAREAGCSRATVYRVFPGGKDTVLAETAQHELLRFFGELCDEARRAEDLESAVVAVLSGAVRRIRASDALQYLLEHEPGVVLPYVSFDGIEPLLALSRDAVGPVLRPHLDDDRTAALAAEWLVRLVVSYGIDDAGLEHDQAARRLARTYVLPGLIATRSEGRNPDTPIPTTHT